MRELARAAAGFAAVTPGPTPPIEVDFPDLERWAEGNTGTPYVWKFASGRPGPNVLVQALTHGNEVCGAIAVDRLLQADVRPTRGTLTFVFANVAAYRSFNHDDPYASRCVDEDFNRLWTAETLDGPRQSADLYRARQLRRIYDDTQFLLDLHSMTDPCPPLALAGRHPKGLALAREIGIPQTIVVDGGHAAGKRLRDYAFFDDPDDPRNALLVECGQHWERTAPAIALQCTLRFLRHFGMAETALLDAHLAQGKAPPQNVIAVTDAITIRSDGFRFVLPVHGLMVVPKAGTLLAVDGGESVVTPYDECVLIMPTRKPKSGETAVRLGKFVQRGDA